MSLCFLIAVLGRAAAAEAAALGELAAAYEKLLGLAEARKDPCALDRAAIVTDKPVYRPGESVFASLYSFNLLTKRPSQCAQRPSAALEMFDALNRLVARFTAGEKTEAFGQSFNLTLSDDLPAGLYRLRQSLHGDETVIYLLRFAPRRAALRATWDHAVARVGEELRGELCLRGPAGLKAQNVTYAFQSNFCTLLEETQPLIGGCLEVRFVVPKSFVYAIAFTARAVVGGAAATYKKEFYEPEHNQAVVHFGFETGRAFAGLNAVYFRAWAGRQVQLEVPIASARVVWRGDAGASVVAEGLRTAEEGRGRFELTLAAADFGAARMLVFEAEVAPGLTRKFVIANARTLARSPVGMSVAERVVAPGRNLRVRLFGSGSCTLVVQDKTTLLFGKELDAAADDFVNVPLSRLKEASVGGVVTLQLFVRGEAGLEAVQEMELFVEPAGYLGADLTLPLRLAAGEEFTLRMERMNACGRCADSGGARVFGLLEVVDDSSAAEVDASLHAAGLVTKVFLNGEIYNRERFFINGARYIETLFDPRSMLMSADYVNSIALLLGVQGFRRFFFDPRQVARFLDAPEEDSFFAYRYALLQLLPASAAASPAARVLGGERAPVKLGSALRGAEPAAATPLGAPELPPSLLGREDADSTLHQGFFELKDAREWRIALPNRAGKFSIRAVLFSEDGLYGNLHDTFELRQELLLAAELPPSLYLGERLRIAASLTNRRKVPVTVEVTAGKAIDLAAGATAGCEFSADAATLPRTFEAFDAKNNVLATLRAAPKLVRPGLFRAEAHGAVLLKGASTATLRHKALGGLAWLGGAVRVCVRATAPQLAADAAERLQINCCPSFEAEAAAVLLEARAYQLLERGAANTTRTAVEERLRRHVGQLLSYQNGDKGFRSYTAGGGDARPPLAALALWALSAAAACELRPPAVPATLLEELLAVQPAPDADAQRLADVSLPVGLRAFTAFALARSGRLSKEVAAQWQKAMQAQAGAAPPPAVLENALLGLFFAEMGDKERSAAALAKVNAVVDQQAVDLQTEAAAVYLEVLNTAAGKRGAMLPLFESLLAGLAGTQPSPFALVWIALAGAELLGGGSGGGEAAEALRLAGDVRAEATLTADDAALFGVCQEVGALPAGPDEELAVTVSLAAPAARPLFLTLELEGEALKVREPAVAQLMLKTKRDVLTAGVRYTVSLKNLDTEPQSLLVYEAPRPACYAFDVEELEMMRISGRVLHYELRRGDTVLVLYLAGLGAKKLLEFSFALAKRFDTDPCAEQPHVAYAFYKRDETAVAFLPA